MKSLIKLYKNKSGQGLSEYALIISLIVLAVFGSVKFFGIEVGTLYNKIINNLPF